MNASIPVNPNILTWARAELNLSIDDVAYRMKKEPCIILSWEEGSSSPTYVQLEKLAYEIYKIPLAVFFFSEPPEPSKVKSSFRTTPNAVYDMIPSSVIKVFREAESMIDNLYELNEGRELSNQRNILRDLAKSDIVNTAKAVRQYLGVSMDEQKSWNNSETALKVWREKVTEAGIFIFRNPFKGNEYSGFCLYDESFPIIYLNSSSSKNRQIFTIFHELWHLLSRTSGIDFLHDDRVIHYYDGSSKDIEVQCNRFAAEFLFPVAEFEKLISQYAVNEKTFSDISSEYSVSREVVLRRFLDYKLVTQTEYDRFSAKWNEEMLSNKQTGGGSYFKNEMSYLGEQYLNMAFDAYYRNNISSSQLADYLNIKEKTLPDFEANYIGRVMA
jgi:Zn-dependent peptidase ImmA (M78 family)/transcriptional regulator with XRE-family HTH domain